MLGISTCWWNSKSLRGDEIVREALALGFKGTELEYRLQDITYQEMKPNLDGKLEVLSVHNYFPKPEDPLIEKGSGDLFLLSSDDRDERSMAVEYSIKTIEHANDLECSNVILHLGRVDMPGPIARFKELFNKGRINDAEGRSFLEEQKSIRQSIHRKYLDFALFSLEKLNRAAEKNNVLLGIENRYHFHEIPDFEEIGFILKEFKGSNLRYWHDVGHAQVQENLGICRQKDFLDAYSNDMVGIHLHDTLGFDDHFAPGQGEIDYSEISPYINTGMIQIMEIKPKVERDALLKGRDMLIETL